MDKSAKQQTRKRKCGTCKSCLSPDCDQGKYCFDKSKFGGPHLLRRPCMERKCDKFSSRRKKLPTFNQIETFELGYKIKECSIQLQRLDEDNANGNEIKKDTQKTHKALKDNIDFILFEATKILHQNTDNTSEAPKR